jgi:hypothetical protein
VNRLVLLHRYCTVDELTLFRASFVEMLNREVTDLINSFRRV